MASVEDVLDQVDGLRRDAADRVQARFTTVAALAAASTDELTQVKGIGAVMADRIHAVAAGAKGGAASARASADTAAEKATTAARQGVDRARSTASTASARARGVRPRRPRRRADGPTRPAVWWARWSRRPLGPPRAWSTRPRVRRARSSTRSPAEVADRGTGGRHPRGYPRRSAIPPPSREDRQPMPEVERYDPSAIEPAIAQRWYDERTYTLRDDHPGPRYYALTMFPYPSGDLHMGHAEIFSLHDALVRHTRMTGRAVLNPIGWDAFGLPAENAAKKRGADPQQWTYDNIEEQRRSIVRLGYSFDWSTRLHTCDPEYYHWTQWIFLELLDAGLAYRKEALVNWCPGLPDGAGQRAGHRRALRTLRRRRRAPPADPVVLPHHRLRRRADRGPRDHRLARTRQADAAQLDRSLRGRRDHLPDRRRPGRWEEPGGGRLHHPPRHDLRRDLLRLRPRAPAGAVAHGRRRRVRRVHGRGRSPVRDRAAVDGGRASGGCA